MTSVLNHKEPRGGEALCGKRRKKEGEVINLSDFGTMLDVVKIY